MQQKHALVAHFKGLNVFSGSIVFYLTSISNSIHLYLRVDMCGDFCNGIGFYVMLTEVSSFNTLFRKYDFDIFDSFAMFYFQAPAFFKALLPLGEDPDTLGYICAIPLLGRYHKCWQQYFFILILSNHLVTQFWWQWLSPISRALYGFTCGAFSDYMINSGRISRLNMQKVVDNFF